MAQRSFTVGSEIDLLTRMVSELGRPDLEEEIQSLAETYEAERNAMAEQTQLNQGHSGQKLSTQCNSGAVRVHTRSPQAYVLSENAVAPKPTKYTFC